MLHLSKTGMSKGKYKRKREHAQAKAKQEIMQTALMSGEIIATEKRTETANNTKKQRDTKKGPSVGFRERLHALAERSSLTDWIIALFTFILVGAAIYQFVIMNGQLETMQIDQRAWMKVGAVPDKPGDDHVTWQIASGQPVVYPVRFVNTGKTPATDIDMSVFIEIVDADKGPHLEYVDAPDADGHPHARATSGISFPNADVNQRISRIGGDGSPRTATNDEVKAVNDGKAYLAVYGIIKYDDVFKRHQWTKFCMWMAQTGTFQARECTQYNHAGTD